MFVEGVREREKREREGGREREREGGYGGLCLLKV